MRVLRFLYNSLTTIIVAAVVVLALLLAGVRLIGLTPYTVLSGSMEPTYKVGSLIYVQKIDTGDIEIGDPITFVLNKSLAVATHRVTQISGDGEYFITKGDANDTEDGEPVYYKNILGKPVFTIPMLGYLSSFLESKNGRVIAISAVIILVIITFLPDLLFPKEKSKAKKAETQSDRQPTVKNNEPSQTDEKGGEAVDKKA